MTFGNWDTLSENKNEKSLFFHNLKENNELSQKLKAKIKNRMKHVLITFWHRNKTQSVDPPWAGECVGE